MGQKVGGWRSGQRISDFGMRNADLKARSQGEDNFGFGIAD